MLADEINRAPAKVQAALLEAMEERQVTVAGTTHPLPPVFLVMAIMLIQNWAAAAGVMASSAAILLFSWLQLEAGILLAGLCGMLVSALIDQGQSSK